MTVAAGWAGVVGGWLGLRRRRRLAELARAVAAGWVRAVGYSPGCCVGVLLSVCCLSIVCVCINVYPLSLFGRAASGAGGSSGSGSVG